MEDEWEPPVPIGYNDTSRAFLQAFMARGSMTFTEGQKLLAEIITAQTGEPVDPRTVTMDHFHNYIRTAREAIEALDFDIRNTRHQVRNGERVWAFINAHSDPATQMGTTRSPEEVDYIKRLLDAMFDEYNTPRMEVMAVDEGQALKVSRPPRNRESGVNNHSATNGEGSSTAPTDRGLKHSEVLSLLSSLVAEGWLEKSRDGFYSLSPRSLMELWSWLVATYNDPDVDNQWQNIKFCEACKEIVTYGQRCAERDCIARLHDICEEAFWRARRDKKCPKCKTEWTGNHFVGERAVTSRSGFQRGRGRRSNGRRSDLAEAVAAQQAVVEEEEDEDGEGEMDED
ncbi:Nse1 non-SMC component of SMC5-6 complex-domain-containing protein [Apodospora peruviana]|uniref:Non-structural maintenance of chromosomes element 1 homolog n=1 Tax=Apodospora peruviana TaxID=516989 RepID=A0AAE0LZA3_9PEZI|nr:Nse1 non-SMC component of SMC5-6 complex-domain-containing protein [Apodospora peruviana]